MPSIVWDYFDEFEGGGKCRLCGCIRNRKDKSTSTFWQHLERVHGLDKRLMLPNSPAINSLGDGGKKVKQTNNFNEINNYSNNITQKRHLEVNEIYSRDEQPVEKMPKLELMTELEKRATEETLKFISELVNQQKQTSPQPCSSTDWQNNNFNYSQNIKRNELIVKNECCPISSPIGINFNNFEYNQNPIIPLNKKIEPFEGSGLSLNDYMSGFLDSNHSLKNGSVNSETKTKCPLDENKKRSDYLNWEEFFMGTAILASLRSKDPCTQVGACIIKENKIVGTGYNGMPNGCNDDDMPWGKGNSDKFNTKYLYVCHAEMNAIANGNFGQFKDATLYTTRFPCNECAKLIIQSGIKNVVYLKDKDCIETKASKRLFDTTKINYSQFQPIRSQIVINFE